MDAVGRYSRYRATLSPGFSLPVSVIYREAQGSGLAEIALTQGGFLFSMVVSKHPTGYINDRLTDVGRRRCWRAFRWCSRSCPGPRTSSGAGSRRPSAR